MQPKVFRPWIQVAVLVVVFVVFLLVGVATLTQGGYFARRDYPGIVIYSVVIVAGLWGLWRTSRLGVRVGPEGLRLRNMGRDRLVPWSEITKVTADRSDIRFGVPIYAPIITVAGDGKPVPVAPMSSYRKSDAQKRADLLRQFIAAAR